MLSRSSGGRICSARADSLANVHIGEESGAKIQQESGIRSQNSTGKWKVGGNNLDNFLVLFSTLPARLGVQFISLF